MSADESVPPDLPQLTEEQRRWRLILGRRCDELSPAMDSERLSPPDRRMDRCLEMVYGGEGPGSPGSGDPYVPTWLEALRKAFPQSVARVIQSDAVRKPGWERMILEPEVFPMLSRDVHTISQLLALKDLVPERAKDLARTIVREVVKSLQARIRRTFERALGGAVDQKRIRRGPVTLLDWKRTVNRNLKHYCPELGTVVPETVLFRQRRTSRREVFKWEVIVLVDQSGSMASSLIHASVVASVLASMRTVATRLLLFDDKVVDMSQNLADPVDILFGAQLGGGTLIADAVAYGARLVRNPSYTLFALISDLYDGSGPVPLVKELRALHDRGVHVACLLGMTNESVPHYDAVTARMLSMCGISTLCCTPDKFAEMIARVINGQPVVQP